MFKMDNLAISGFKFRYLLKKVFGAEYYLYTFIILEQKDIDNLFVLLLSEVDKLASSERKVINVYFFSAATIYQVGDDLVGSFMTVKKFCKGLIGSEFVSKLKEIASVYKPNNGKEGASIDSLKELKFGGKK